MICLAALVGVAFAQLHPLDDLDAALTNVKSLEGEVYFSRQGYSETGRFKILKPDLIRMDTSLASDVFDGKNGFHVQRGQYAKVTRSAVALSMRTLIGFGSLLDPKWKLSAAGGSSKVQFLGADAIATPVSPSWDVPVDTLITLYIAPDTKLPLGYQIRQGDLISVGRYSKVQTTTTLTAPDFAYTPPKGMIDVTAPDLDSKLLPVPSAAPTFKLSTADGGGFDLEANLPKANGFIIIFWFDTKACRDTLAKAEAIFRRLKEQGLRVVAINAVNTPSEIKKLSKEIDLSFPLLVDKSSVTEKYGVTACPTTYVVSGSGTILARFTGWDTDTLGKTLARLGFR